MSDRDLLELAAKAAGFGAPDTGGTCWTESEYPRGSGLHGALWNYVGYMDTAQLWNPLTDDGDLLRLARQLGISIDYADCCAWKRLPDGTLIQEFWGTGEWGDEAHAIVRAAAEISRNKAGEA
jgi:hypothetical protein